jgi:HEAT repeat protein
LQKIGKPAVPPLVSLCKRGNTAEIATMAAKSLGETHEPEALKALCAMLKDPALGLPGDAVAGLNAYCAHLAKGDEAQKDRMLMDFASAFEGNAIDAVVAIFKDKSRPIETRKDAATVMEHSRNPRAVEPLAEAMADTNDKTRYTGFNVVWGLCIWTSGIQASIPGTAR